MSAVTQKGTDQEIKGGAVIMADASFHRNIPLITCFFLYVPVMFTKLQ